MDTLTHGLAGAVLAWALPAERKPADRTLHRAEIWTGFATAMFPDADVLLSPFSPEFYITQHRGLSHSFFLLPLWALLLGGAAYGLLCLRKTPPPRLAFARLSLVSGIGVLSHILLDWITSWGTMFFSPLSWERYSLDWVFIIDFVFSGLLILGLIGSFWIARRSVPRGRLGARATLLASSLYVMLCASRHGVAMQAGVSLLPVAGSTRAAIPQPLSPNRWLVLGDDGVNITAYFLDLGKRGLDPHPSPTQEGLESVAASARGIEFLVRRLEGVYRSVADAQPRVIPKADGPLALRTLLNGRQGIFGRFARFPAARETRDPDGITHVLLRDARFGYLSPAIDPFTYSVSYDPAGKLLSAGFPSQRWAQNGAMTGTAVAR
ncbi:MAG: metal-dependent hydrolase [Thermoanaerobaculia bacterium]